MNLLNNTFTTQVEGSKHYITHSMKIMSQFCDKEKTFTTRNCIELIEIVSKS